MTERIEKCPTCGHPDVRATYYHAYNGVWIECHYCWTWTRGPFEDDVIAWAHFDRVHAPKRGKPRPAAYH